MSKFSAKQRREKVAIEKIEFDIVVANDCNTTQIKISIKINFTTMRYELGNSLRLLTRFVCIDDALILLNGSKLFLKN